MTVPIHCMEPAFSQSLPATMKKMGLSDVVAYLSVKSREDIVSCCFVARCKKTNNETPDDWLSNPLKSMGNSPA